MLLHTRWIKILKDIWRNKGRSALVILSIAVGIAAVGMINNTARIVDRDLLASYPDGNPVSVLIYTSPFQLDLARAVENMREVELVEPRRQTSAVVIAGEPPYENIDLLVFEDFADNQISQLDVEAGPGVPGVREIMLERKSAEALGLTAGDTLTLEVASTEQRYTLTVSSIVHDVYSQPYTLTGIHAGYMSMETLRWMGLPAYYNRLDIIVAENKTNPEHVLDVAAQIRDRVVEPSGYVVGNITFAGFDTNPGEFWAQNQMDGFLLILRIMGVLAIFLSGGLVINTITAMLTQQVKQIGIMRSVGAVRGQLVQMYLANVLVFSILALLVAIPMALVGSWALGDFAANFLNFDVSRVDLSWQIIGTQALIGILMPIVVAMYPIVAGTRISVYDAIYQMGISTEGKQGPIERLLVKLKGIAPPVLLSLRNTFRKKARLIFTLLTLTMAGAMFISVFSTRSSLEQAVDEIQRYFMYDARLSVSGGLSSPTVLREAERIPGVEAAEVWAFTSAQVLTEDSAQGEGETVSIFATPESENLLTMEPMLLQGRWLQPGDTNAVVVNEDLVTSRPEIELGSTITIELNGIERDYVVVGIVSRHLVGARIYMDYNAFSKATNQSNPVNEVRVRTNTSVLGSPQTQDSIAQALEKRFTDAGLSQSTSGTQHADFASFSTAFNIILIILIVMAGILAVVGGLSLTGTMGMNVFERTREIGVLRAVGASTGAVRQVVVVEGVVVGLISWLFAAALSVPVGLALASAVVRIVMDSDLVFSYALWSLGAWLGIVVLIGIFGSLIPARNAAVLTVREVLDYE